MKTLLESKWGLLISNLGRLRLEHPTVEVVLIGSPNNLLQVAINLSGFLDKRNDETTWDS